jgi:hypothetical protein
MQSRNAFYRAVYCLSHPLTIAAVILLLVNDHWLRWHHPSWLTGKLGDFTWLMFAPFIAAAVLAWLIPGRIRNHEQVVGLVSFGLIGLWFGLAKTVPLVHELTTSAWESIIGWEGSLRMDASDLLTLPALLIGWWLWQRAKGQALSLRPLATVVFALGIVATLATSPPRYRWSDSGILKLCQEGSSILTPTDTEPRLEKNPSTNLYTVEIPRSNVFRSSDGGLTWTHQVEENFETDGMRCSNQEVNTTVDPNDDAIQYRWKSGGPIERSNDGGQTWVVDYPLVEMQQDVRRYYNHTSYSGNIYYQRHFFVGPMSGLVDQTTGNLVLAMSWDGVLVRTASDGQWHWVSVGDQYKLVDIQRFEKIGNILFFEAWLSGAMVFLVVTTATAYMRQHSIDWGRVGFLIIGWVSWIVLTAIILPQSMAEDNYLPMRGAFRVGLLGLPLLVFLAIPLSIGSVWDIARNFRPVALPIVLVAVGVAALYLLPFIPWTQGTIPRYNTALRFALFLAGAGLVAGRVYLLRVLPVVDKAKYEGKKKMGEEDS